MIALIIATVCAALFSILFKIFEIRKIDSAQAIVVNYLTAFILGMLLSKGGNADVNPFKEDWFIYAIGLGFIFYAGMAVLSYSTRMSGVAVSTIASRASMVIPIIVCFLFIEGSARPRWLLIAIIIAALALTVFGKDGVQKGETGNHDAASVGRIAGPVIVFFTFGISNSMLKLLQNSINVKYMSLGDSIVNSNLSLLSATIFVSALLFGLLFYIAKGKESRKPFQWKNVAGGVLLGVSNYFCTYLLMISMKTIDSAILFPFHNVGIVTIGTLAGWLCFSEKLNVRQITGIVLAVIAICMMYI